MNEPYTCLHLSVVSDSIRQKIICIECGCERAMATLGAEWSAPKPLEVLEGVVRAARGVGAAAEAYSVMPDPVTGEGDCRELPHSPPPPEAILTLSMGTRALIFDVRRQVRALEDITRRLEDVIRHLEGRRQEGR